MAAKRPDEGSTRGQWLAWAQAIHGGWRDPSSVDFIDTFSRKQGEKEPD